MVALVICKNEEYPIKKGARVVTGLYIDFSDAQGQLIYYVVGDGILTNFKLIQAFFYGCPC